MEKDIDTEHNACIMAWIFADHAWIIDGNNDDSNDDDDDDDDDETHDDDNDDDDVK